MKLEYDEIDGQRYIDFILTDGDMAKLKTRQALHARIRVGKTEYLVALCNPQFSDDDEDSCRHNGDIKKRQSKKKLVD